MSQFDQGKHNLGSDSEGQPIRSAKRLDAQRESKQLTARIKEHEDTVRSLKGNGSAGFHKPGSQNRAK